jgi:predicted deacylase
MKSIRSYQKLVNEILNLNLGYEIEIIGYVNYDYIYPLLKLKYISKTAKNTVVILSGQHGDEPYAVHTLLQWLKQPIMLTDFNYYIYPIINPWGFEHACRDNGVRQDTNNAVNFKKDSQVQELAILYDHIPSNINLMLDIHGDNDKKQVYLYEHKADTLNSIAQKTLLETDKFMPYLKQKTIYGCPLVNGVLKTPKEDVGIEGAVEKLSVDYTITLELPGIYDGQKRVDGGVNIINSLLYNFKETI